ncbi:MAG: prepilin-type N-terminal cleavage/methylation domain-containing protein, partial [Bacilli bacterium]|nr:prepilin-type N-terminal cleavage/methylation domain-containing protein [Bacilli bacterium]
MKKGFTLVELLAVIVILAVIALISVPIILGIIEKSKKGATEDSAYGILEAANLYYAT